MFQLYGLIKFSNFLSFKYLAVNWSIGRSSSSSSLLLSSTKSCFFLSFFKTLGLGFRNAELGASVLGFFFLGRLSVAGVAATCDLTGLYLTLPIGIFTFFWISGFDILYALQDYQHDIKNDIFSVPSIYGINNAIKISSVCFIISLIAICYYSFIYTFNFLSILIILIILMNYIFQIIHSFRELCWQPLV